MTNPNPERLWTTSWSPATLRQFEERLTLAHKCGIETIEHQGTTVDVTVGQLLSIALRQKFATTYSARYIQWVMGPAPAYTHDFEPEQVAQIIKPEYLGTASNRTGS